MIKLQYITQFDTPEKMAQLRGGMIPTETVQLIQLVQFWASQHGVTIIPSEVSEDQCTKVDTFMIPTQDIADQLTKHSLENGIDLSNIFASMKQHVEALGGTFTKVQTTV
jgi:hypothetical protein